MPRLLIILLPDATPLDDIVTHIPTEAVWSDAEIEDVMGPSSRHLQDRYGKAAVVAVLESWKDTHRA